MRQGEVYRKDLYDAITKRQNTDGKGISDVEGWHSGTKRQDETE